MDTQPQTTKPISDDQELAKVLAGVSQETNNDLSFEETPSSIPNPDASALPPAPQAPITPQPDETPQVTTVPEPVSEFNLPTLPVNAITPSDASNDSLDGIKKDALTELRPLVDKLDLTPEEKFDIYLLLIRSTDDTTLIAPAHVAAQSITDETKKAQALLDIIKEIDFLSAPQQQTI